MDFLKITFVMLNRFCVTLFNLNPVLNGQYQDRWNTTQNQMKNTPTFYILFQVLKVLLIKICKMSGQVDLLLFSISFYISRYHFSQILRTSLNIIWRKISKISITSFHFLTNSLNDPHPLPPPPLFNDYNPLGVMKPFSWCFLSIFQNLWSVYHISHFSEN